LDKAKKDFQILRNASVQISEDRQRKTSITQLLQRGPEGALKKKAKVEERSRGDSEVKIQVTRFRKGGSCFEQVVMLADDWLIPLIKSYASMSLSEEQVLLFESYDPMNWDKVEGELSFQMLKLQQYIAKLRKAIDNIYSASIISATPLISGATPAAATVPPTDDRNRILSAVNLSNIIRNTMIDDIVGTLLIQPQGVSNTAFWANF
jgi:hypothetical protein